MILALDFLNDAMDSLGKPQISTLEVATETMRSDHRKALRLLNRILNTIGAYNDWPMLREEGTLVLVAAEETDADSSEYVTATNGDTTLTVANYAFDDTYIGRVIQVSGDDYVYLITAAPSPTTVTLNRGWVSDSVTVADELTATIAMGKYVLPEDFGRPVDDWDGFFAPYNIKPISPNELKKRRRDMDSNKISVSEPKYYTVFGTQGGRQVVHFHPYPEYARMLTFDYQRNHPPITSDNDTILYPLTYNEALLDLFVALSLRDYDDSTKMDRVIQDWIQAHNRQQSNPGPTDSRPVLTPANEVRRSIRAGYGVPASVDWGDSWDTGALFGF